jgi:hypothetical protein
VFYVLYPFVTYLPTVPRISHEVHDRLHKPQAHFLEISVISINSGVLFASLKYRLYVVTSPEGSV